MEGPPAGGPSCAGEYTETCSSTCARRGLDVPWAGEEMDGISEREVVTWWRAEAARGRRLTTDDGRLLRVVYPGRLNDGRGGDFCDAVITADDDPDLIDTEQGVPHLKGMRCALEKLSADEIARVEAQYGPTNELPRGPEGKVLKPKSKPDDFMYDELAGDGVEFEAMELSIYGRTSSM